MWLRRQTHKQFTAHFPWDMCTSLIWIKIGFIKIVSKIIFCSDLI